MPNYPNPFNPETAIAVQPAGFYRETWEGNDELGRPAASGVYLYRLTAGAQVASRRMLLLR